MRVIITGSDGFIGSHLTRELQDAGHPVAGLDIKNGEDVRKPDVVREAIQGHRADVLVHLASARGDDVMETARDNVGMTSVVAEVCGETGVRLVYLSTAEIYGMAGLSVCDEYEGPFLLPENILALNKFWGESAGRLLARDEFTALRLAQTYGPGKLAVEGELGNDEITDLLWRASHGKPIAVPANAERSWIYIYDAVRAIRLAIERGGDIYNIGVDGDKPTMLEAASIACGLVGADTGLIEEFRAPPMIASRLSTQRIRRLGWEPGVTLYEGMKHTLEAWVTSLDGEGKLTVELEPVA